MNRPNRELGFFTLVSIVIGSQIGSGTFILPSLLAPFGSIGLFGWIISASGAIALSLIFSELSSRLPKTGGPHVYVTESFGRTAGFFTAWVYWIVSWSSNSILLVTAVYYLSTITGELAPIQAILLEVLMLFAITFINIRGVKFSGRIESVLVFFKVLPLFAIPLIFFCVFDGANFNFEASVDSLVNGSLSENLGTIAKAALLTSWGYIGVECATTPAGRVRDPKKTIPRALILGTSCVSLIYVLNVISVVGVIGFEPLLNSKAPYAIAIGQIFGYSSNVLIAILALIICIGTLNAWTLSGGQIAQGAADDKLFPPFFGKTNKNGAPINALLVASIGNIPFFIMEKMYGSDGLNYLIDTLVNIFLFVYIFSALAFVKKIKEWKTTRKEQIKSYILASFAIAFCLFIALQDILHSLIVLGISVLIGIPVFLRMKKKQID